MKKYELVVLLSPSFSEQNARDFLETFVKEHLTAGGGAVFFEDFWGKQTLAYPIRKENAAFYAVLGIDIDSTKLSAFDESIRLEKNILRHLITLCPSGKIQTLAEIKAWNVDNLPEPPKSKKPEEKRAVLKRRGGGRSPRNDQRKAVPSSAQPPVKKVDKARLDKELDAILEG